MLATLLLMIAQFMAVADAQEPIAMVLSVKGAASLERGNAKSIPLLTMSIVRAGDTLKTSDGEAVLVILSDSHWERLKPNSQATAEKKGCSPASSVEITNHPKLPVESLKGLPDLDPGQRAGVAVLRSSDPIPEPIYGTVLRDNRPDFAWPADDVDTEKTPIDDFQLDLMAGDLQGKLLWNATTTALQLKYPADKAALEPGEKYAWRVTARLHGGTKQVLIEGRFSLATAKQRESLAETDKLAASESWPDQLLAAALYDSHGYYGEAAALYERLVSSAKRPRGADATKNVESALESCYARAQRAIPSKKRDGAEKARALRSSGQTIRGSSGKEFLRSEGVMSLRRLLLHPGWRGVRRGIVCALVAWMLARTSLLQGLEEWLHDACFLWRSARTSAAKIVVIGVDEQSADDLKKPLAYISPQLADVVTYAKGQGAAAIGIDLFVPESMQGLPEIADEKGLGAAASLGQAILAADNVVLPEWYLQSENRWLKPLPLWQFKSITNPELTDLGFVNLDEDDDQFVRRQQLLTRRGSGEKDAGSPVPHFALALLARAQGSKIEWDEATGTITVGDLNIPLEDKKLLRINFAGPPGTYKPIPFSQVRAAAEKGLPTPELRGAIVLIGVTAQSQQDYHSTPYANRYARYLPGPDGGLMSGTEVHAHILATLLDRAFITTPIGFAGLPWLVVVGGLLGYVFSRLSLEWGLLIAVVHHFAWKGIALAGFTYFNWRIEMVPMLALGMLIYSVTFAFRWRELRRMFGVVKSAAVVRALEADPRRLDPGGEEREATVLFADIRGFTRFSEGRPPREVVTLLNAYFSAVIPVVEAEGGTVDKFIGDGLMVLFGVPISLADHAPRGVRAGVAMVRRVHELHETWTRLGFDKLRIGVGIHTGPVVAGAIGTRHRIDYTAIGDTVNTASRIESENSKQGTEVLISATALAALSENERQQLGPLGKPREVSVKNRTEPLVLYPVEFDL